VSTKYVPRVEYYQLRDAPLSNEGRNTILKHYRIDQMEFVYSILVIGAISSVGNFILQWYDIIHRPNKYGLFDEHKNKDIKND